MSTEKGSLSGTLLNSIWTGLFGPGEAIDPSDKTGLKRRITAFMKKRLDSAEVQPYRRIGKNGRLGALNTASVTSVAARFGETLSAHMEHCARHGRVLRVTLGTGKKARPIYVLPPALEDLPRLDAEAGQLEATATALREQVERIEGMARKLVEAAGGKPESSERDDPAPSEQTAAGWEERVGDGGEGEGEGEDEAFIAALLGLDPQGRGWVPIWQLRRRLGWPRAAFDSTVGRLRQGLLLDLHVGDPGALDADQVVDSFTDGTGQLYIHATWRGDR